MSSNINIWSKKELEVVKDTNLSHRDVANQIGRSYAAVKRKRLDLGITGQKTDIIKWTNDEKRFLIENLDISNEVIAEKLNRTVSEVSNKITRMGLQKKTKNFFSEDEEAYLVENYFRESTRQIAKKLSRSVSSIADKAHELGLRKTKRQEYWSKKDTEILIDNWDEDIDILCELTGKSRNSVIYKRAHINSSNTRKKKKEYIEDLKSELRDDIPFSRESASERYLDLLSVMEIGQSFEFPQSEYSIFINTKSVFTEKVFKTMSVDSKTRRCWRLE